ncbi:MAG: DNA mismatch repair protein MutS [Bacteroidota bacterium]
MAQPLEIFNDNVQKFEEQASTLRKKYSNLSVMRIIAFIVSLVVFVYLANDRSYWGVVIVLLTFPFAFGLLIRYHNRIGYRMNHYKLLKKINQQEIQKANGDLGQFDQGTEFNENSHPYTNDLDIFGKNSLFQLLNRTTTVSGKAMLAKWLKKAATKETILDRQEAVKELTSSVEWRQDFQASGMHFQDEKNEIHVLLEWIKEETEIKNRSLYLLASWAMPILLFTILGLVAFKVITIYYFFGILAINGIILRSFYDPVKDITDKAYKSTKTLKSYASLIRMIEESNFHSKELTSLKANFNHDNFKASAVVGQLQRLLDFLLSRANMLYGLIDLLLLMDIHLLLRAEKWRKENKEEVSKWFDSISEFETINSMAGFAYANPEYAYPVISDNTHYLNAQEMGHPLIKSASRISNDFRIDEGKGEVIIVTGSNMSGKSTFLRTIGVNLVLALAGAPVCSKAFEVSNIQVFTSMRTQDDLEESISSFYAELKRIRQLLDLLEDGDQPVLFMLDEILKGTNSQDRHTGGVALVKQLSKTNAVGLISTHDLDLGNTSKTYENVKNFSFNSKIINDEIIFDYKLTEGVCQSFNASKLMQKIGIQIE